MTHTAFSILAENLVNKGYTEKERGGISIETLEELKLTKATIDNEWEALAGNMEGIGQLLFASQKEVGNLVDERCISQIGWLMAHLSEQVYQLKSIGDEIEHLMHNPNKLNAA